MKKSISKSIITLKSSLQSLCAPLLKLLKFVFRPFIERYKQRIAKKKQLEYEKRQNEIYTEIIERINFEALAARFPFLKRERPNNAKEAIEYLGEFVVTSNIKQTEEARFIEEIKREKESLLDFAIKRLNEMIDEEFKSLEHQTGAEIEKEYTPFTKLGDQLANFGHKVKVGINNLLKRPASENPNPPKEFLQSILDRRFSNANLDELMNTLLNRLNAEVDQKWRSWVSNYYSSSHYIGQFSFRGINWTDPLMDTSQKGLLTSAGFTFVLATGWHTLEWAIGNFLPGALLASTIFSVFKSFADKEKTVLELKTISGKVIGNLRKLLTDTIETKIRPTVSSQLENQENVLISKKTAEIWGTNENIKPHVEFWLKKIEGTFRKIGIRYSEAEAKFQMENGLEKGREFLNDGPIEAAIFFFGQAFDGFSLWCMRKRNIEWDPYKENYVRLIERMKERGYSEPFLLDFNKLRKRRNNLIHEYSLLSQNKYDEVKAELEEAFKKIEELIIQV